MNAYVELFAAGIVRATLVTGAAALLAIVLLRLLRVRHARTHRRVWLLVIAQGWLLMPYTFRVEVTPAPAKSPATAPMQLVSTTVPAMEQTTPVLKVPAETFDLLDFVLNASLWLWAGGMVALVGVGLIGYVQMFVVGRPGRAPDESAWQAEWDEVRNSSASGRRAELRITRQLGPLVCYVPFTFLVLTPRALWGRLSRCDRIAILRHELAHCERGDLWKNLAVRLLALPQWFSPLVWLAVRRFEEAGEWACDERASRHWEQSHTWKQQSSDYARALLRVADYSAQTPCGAVAATGGQLSRRVKRLLNSPNKEVREMRGLIIPALLLVVGLMQAVRVERVVADETSHKPTVAEATKESSKAWWGFDQPYVIEPPDILLINVKNVVPKSPHKIEPFDGLLIRATGVDDERAPIADAFAVQPEGYIDLGPSYGRVQVQGATIEKAKAAIHKQLAHDYPNASVSMSLAFAAATQQIVGEHLVGPDGRVNLGAYGSIYVAGTTLPEAKKALEKHLSKDLVAPEVTVDVFASNSKRAYIITKDVTRGDNVVTLPVSGNETVLDAITLVGGVEPNMKLWIDRPTKNGKESLIKPVDYEAITVGGDDSTNYQLWPGDRLFVESTGGSKVDGRPNEPLTPPASAYQATPDQPADETPLRSIPATRGLFSPAETAGDEKQLKVTIRFVRDSQQNLRAVPGLRSGTTTIGESQLLIGLVRVLEQNKLAKVVAAPAIRARAGEQVSVSTGAADWLGAKPAENPEPVKTPSSPQLEEQLCVTLASQLSASQAVFQLDARVGDQSWIPARDAVFALHEGQSCLLRLSESLLGSEGYDCYLLVSREE